jgi:hypothetical protein
MAQTIVPTCPGFVELDNLKIEELHTFVVGQRGTGSAWLGLAWLGFTTTTVNKVKKPAVPTEADHIRGVGASGRYNATVGSEAEARRIIQGAMPDAVEVPRAPAGQPNPTAAPGIKKWFQVQPPEPQVGNDLPHIKYENWADGKKKSGGSWGHLFFPPSES